jgi:His-Xaa-Ser system radical SAM maturase HxsC
MLRLTSRGVEVRSLEFGSADRVLRLREGRSGNSIVDTNEALLGKGECTVPDQLVVRLERDCPVGGTREYERNLIVLPNEFEYLADGDVISISPRNGSIRVLYRRNSKNNSFLLTERCNHYCLMCSQPPKDIDDHWLIDDALKAVPLISKDTNEITLTGGEPTLLGERFLELVRVMRDQLPTTALHILSNGRRFIDREFAQSYAAINHPDSMVGIPIYAAVSQLHDYVVQADGAFDETIRGILNLKSLGQRVEIRVVVHRQNYEALVDLAEFIARNLTFVDQVAFMGLEMTGFAKANLLELWIDPLDYRNELSKAASVLQDLGVRTFIYNHQLCILEKRLWPLSVRSISDWKNEYRPECGPCVVKERCAGFFETGRLRRSAHIAPILDANLRDDVGAQAAT